MDQLLRKLFELIHSYSNFILVTHLNPDIDGIASMLSLHLFLKSLNKASFPLIEDMPENAEFLPSSKELILVKNFNSIPENFITIILDAHTPERPIPQKEFMIKYTKKFPHPVFLS